MKTVYNWSYHMISYQLVLTDDLFLNKKDEVSTPNHDLNIVFTVSI